MISSFPNVSRLHEPHLDLGPAWKQIQWRGRERKLTRRICYYCIKQLSTPPWILCNIKSSQVDDARRDPVLCCSTDYSWNLFCDQSVAFKKLYRQEEEKKRTLASHLSSVYIWTEDESTEMGRRLQWRYKNDMVWVWGGCTYISHTTSAHKRVVDKFPWTGLLWEINLVSHSQQNLISDVPKSGSPSATIFQHPCWCYQSMPASWRQRYEWAGVQNPLLPEIQISDFI